MKFTVVLHADDGQLDGVTVPDLPGCFSAGDDLDDALEWPMRLTCTRKR